MEFEVWLSEGDLPIVLRDSALAGDERSGHQVGCSKIGDVWQLAVRYITVETRMSEGDPRQPHTQQNVHGSARALTEAPRLERIAALAHFEKLLHELAEHAEGMVAILDGKHTQSRARR